MKDFMILEFPTGERTELSSDYFIRVSHPLPDYDRPKKLTTTHGCWEQYRVPRLVGRTILLRLQEGADVVIFRADRCWWGKGAMGREEVPF